MRCRAIFMAPNCIGDEYSARHNLEVMHRTWELNINVSSVVWRQLDTRISDAGFDRDQLFVDVYGPAHGDVLNDFCRGFLDPGALVSGRGISPTKKEDARV